MNKQENEDKASLNNNPQTIENRLSISDEMTDTSQIHISNTENTSAIGKKRPFSTSEEQENYQESEEDNLDDIHEFDYNIEDDIFKDSVNNNLKVINNNIKLLYKIVIKTNDKIETINNIISKQEENKKMMKKEFVDVYFNSRFLKENQGELVEAYQDISYEIYYQKYKKIKLEIKEPPKIIFPKQEELNFKQKSDDK